MKHKPIALLLILLPFMVYSQNYRANEPTAKPENTFSLKLGGSYKTFVGNTYIERTGDTKNPQYEGFTKIPTSGFQIGVLWSHELHKNLHLSLGLAYFLRTDIYQGDCDTVLKYGTPTSIHDILKYEYYYNNIELPILLSYNLKKINFHIGVNLAFLTFYKAVYTYIPNQNAFNDKTSKTINSFELAKDIFPTFQISYNAKYKRYSFKPFFGIDIGRGNSVYLQLGLIVPITGNPVKNQ